PLRISCCPVAHPVLPSFPTRRSSDLGHERVVNRHAHALFGGLVVQEPLAARIAVLAEHQRLDANLHTIGRPRLRPVLAIPRPALDRKSTRLNSSHVKISYAVFCLKKK